MTTLKAGDKITIKDLTSTATYPVGYVTSDMRCLIDMGMGTWVGADFIPESKGSTPEEYNPGGWQLSGDPVSADERGFIENQPGFGQTQVQVTKDP
jgi:hypothetical protein